MLTKLVKHTYNSEDVTFLLQDLEGKVEAYNTEERERLNQSGVHYSEMLPIEDKPSKEYMDLYYKSLNNFGVKTAESIAILAHKIYNKTTSPVLVSLARAGTPVGILLRKYFTYKWGTDCKHYTVSIIRGKGIDTKAMEYILSKHNAKDIVFVDGWVGKGAINKELAESCKKLNVADLSPEIAVISDPANITTLYGTREDFLIPHSCLNAIISGGVSRTVQLKDMDNTELHGAIFYENINSENISNEYINIISNLFDKNVSIENDIEIDTKGMDEVEFISNKYNVSNINFIKPGVGETTRVLLRRKPDIVLVKKDSPYIENILMLSKEKEVEVIEEDLKHYSCVGIVKAIADI